jgi:hypothetical protein
MSLSQDIHGTRMFVFGGNDGQQPLNDLFVLVTMTWSQLFQRGPGPNVRVGHTMNMVCCMCVFDMHALFAECTVHERNLGQHMTPVFQVGNKIYVIGGASEDFPYNDIHVYDTSTTEWSIPHVSGAIPKALVAHSTVCVGNEFFVFGGGDGAHFTSELLVLDLDEFHWDTPAMEGIMPKGRYGHAACMHLRSMYIFGGFSVSVSFFYDLLSLKFWQWRPIAVWLRKYVVHAGHCNDEMVNSFCERI